MDKTYIEGFKKVLKEPYAQQVCDLYVNNQISLSKLSRQFEVSEFTIRNTLAHHNVQIRPSGFPKAPKLNAEYPQEIIRLYGNGLTFQQIGALYGASSMTVRRFLLGHGVTWKFRGSLKR